jgi:hypothetical protein
LVPGAGSLAELPAPLGSLPELFRPAAFAGPGGTPFTAGAPAPAEPALGVPTELLLPAVEPPAEPPEPLPLLCASETAGNVRMARVAIAAVNVDRFIGSLLLPSNGVDGPWFLVPGGTIASG